MTRTQIRDARRRAYGAVRGKGGCWHSTRTTDTSGRMLITQGEVRSTGGPGNPNRLSEFQREVREARRAVAVGRNRQAVERIKAEAREAGAFADALRARENNRRLAAAQLRILGLIMSR